MEIVWQPNARGPDRIRHGINAVRNCNDGLERCWWKWRCSAVSILDPLNSRVFCYVDASWPTYHRHHELSSRFELGTLALMPPVQECAHLLWRHAPNHCRRHGMDSGQHLLHGPLLHLRLLLAGDGHQS